MKHRVRITVLLTGLLVFGFSGLWAQDYQPPVSGEGDYDKRAQTGMKFTTISIDPRASAIGGSVTSLELGASSMFYNPAGMTGVKNFGEVSFGMVQWIAGIQHNQASLALQPGGGSYGTVGLMVRSVDYGEFEGTIRADVEKGYIDTEVFEPNAVEVGLSYARTLTNRFSVGGTVKYVRQNLGSSTVDYESGASLANRETQSNLLGTPAFDFGVRYRIGFKSLTIGMSARNFAPAIEFEEESFELPLTLQMGLSMDMLDLAPALTQNHSLLLSVDAANPRDYSEQLSIGGEYVFMDILSLRGGYVYPHDERGLSMGTGLNYGISGVELNVDYAYTSFGRFENVNRIAMALRF